MRVAERSSACTCGSSMSAPSRQVHPRVLPALHTRTCGEDRSDVRSNEEGPIRIHEDPQLSTIHNRKRERESKKRFHHSMPYEVQAQPPTCVKPATAARVFPHRTSSCVFPPNLRFPPTVHPHDFQIFLKVLARYDWL